MMVDLPGYGYAKVPLSVKRQWGPMMERYLASRAQLKAVVLILDIRRIPSDEDLQMLTWLQAYGREAIIVLTKCDKVSKVERAKQTALISTRLQMDAQQLLHFSSLNKEGKDKVWKAIEFTLESQDSHE
jgi:GTP-binding protein